MSAFVCQRCYVPLQLDSSLVDLAPSAYDLVVGSVPSQLNVNSQPPPSEAEQLAQLPAAPSAKAIWLASAQVNGVRPPGTNGRATSLSPRAQGKQPQRALLPNESFVLLQDSVIRNIPSSVSSSPQGQGTGRTSGNSSRAAMNGAGSGDGDVPTRVGLPPANPPPLSHHLKSTQKLLNLISSRTDVDHPLCSDCTDLLINSIQKQLEETKKERDGYIAFEKEIRREKERERDGMSREEAEKRIEKLREEERVAIEQLREAEREREQLAEEMKALELEEKALEEEEEEFWRGHNAHMLRAAEQSSQLAALRAAYAADSATLERLERTNVYNDAFCIGHDGVFGTINGLRLGRVPGVPVEWAEINAAWGQTLLLLYTIARKLDFTFENYRLVPMGSFSRIERTTGDKATYELHGSGDLHIGRLLHNRRFDFAMVAFLECLKQIIDWAKAQDPSVEFPHQIVKDKIGEASVKLQFSQEEAWTRALRHVLLALKLLLKWTTNVG